jgi:hypothetical protein
MAVNRHALTAFAILPVVGGIIHLTIVAVPKQPRVSYVRPGEEPLVKSVPLDRSAEIEPWLRLGEAKTPSARGVSAASPVYPAMNPAREQYIKSMQHYMRLADQVAREFVLDSIASEVEPGHTAAVEHTNVSGPRQDDPYRERRIADETWHVGGSATYPPKGIPGSEVTVGFTIRLRWDSKRGTWKVVESRIRAVESPPR